MRLSWKPIFTLLLGCWSFSSVSAQNPISWTFTGTEIEAGTYQITLTGTIEHGWSTYSQNLESDMGPVPTSIQFTPGNHFSLIGTATEKGDRSTNYDKVFEMNLTKFKNKALFIQNIKVSDLSQPIKGTITYMACNEEMCLPPKDVPFSIQLTATKIR